MARLSQAICTFLLIFGVFGIASASLIEFSVELTDPTVIGVRLDRPFSIDISFENLPELAVQEAFLTIVTEGDLSANSEYLTIDAEGLAFVMFNDVDDPDVSILSTNPFTVSERAASQAFLPLAISDGTLNLSITGSAGVAWLRPLSISVSYLTESTPVPEPSSITLIVLGFIGIGLARRRT